MQKFQETVLMGATRVGSVGMVRKMIQCGANVNLTNKVTSDWTPCRMLPDVWNSRYIIVGVYICMYYDVPSTAYL